VGREIHALREIQTYAHIKITRQQVPSLAEVEETRTVTLLEKVKDRIEEGGLETYTNLVERLVKDDYSSLDIAAALLKMVLVAEGKEPGAVAEEFAEAGGPGAMARLHLSVGRLDKVATKDIVGAIAGETGLSGRLIGKIDIYDRYTFVEVPREYAHDIVSMMQGRYIKGNKVRIEPGK
jgi:ATP-dependent RNA helicase DeaD